MELFGQPTIKDLFIQSALTLEETFNSGDQEVRTWFLIRNGYLPFILCFAYLIISLYGPSLMRDRKPFDLRMPMIIFNFCVVMTYVTCLFGVAYYLPMIPWEMFCKGGVIKKGEPSYMLASIAWIGYLLRYIELLDTVFFILRKKENLITFLHVMHHAIVPILGWVMFRTEKSALQAVPILLNAFVHVIMYSYYGLAAMGPKFRKYLWWKKYLTQLQIVQFFLIIMFVTVIAPFTGCTMVSLSYAMDIVFAPLFLFLFYRFYRSSFQHNMKKIE